MYWLLFIIVPVNFLSKVAFYEHYSLLELGNFVNNFWINIILFYVGFKTKFLRRFNKNRAYNLSQKWEFISRNKFVFTKTLNFFFFSKNNNFN